MPSVEWHMDIVRVGPEYRLVVIDPTNVWFKHVPLSAVSVDGIAQAVARLIACKTAPPTGIVTDQARLWSGIADLLGVSHRLFKGAETVVMERFARDVSVYVGCPCFDNIDEAKALAAQRRRSRDVRQVQHLSALVDEAVQHHCLSHHSILQASIPLHRRLFNRILAQPFIQALRGKNEG